MYRFKKGSGLPVKVPVIEMIEIGAGGGSIARVDALGLLKVGPDSAGADPGRPATAAAAPSRPSPTPTCCSAISTRTSSSAAGCGSTSTPPSAAIERGSAEPLGLDRCEAAWGIHQVVNENMAGAARIHAVERGKDLAQLPAVRLRRRRAGARLSRRADPALPRA